MPKHIQSDFSKGSLKNRPLSESFRSFVILSVLTFLKRLQHLDDQLEKKSTAQLFCIQNWKS